jgi:hypothetical protein
VKYASILCGCVFYYFQYHAGKLFLCFVGVLFYSDYVKSQITGYILIVSAMCILSSINQLLHSLWYVGHYQTLHTFALCLCMHIFLPPTCFYAGPITKEGGQNIIISYIVTFMFLDGRQEDKKFWTERQQSFPDLSCSEFQSVASFSNEYHLTNTHNGTTTPTCNCCWHTQASLSLSKSLEFWTFSFSFSAFLEHQKGNSLNFVPLSCINWNGYTAPTVTWHSDTEWCG